MKRTKIITFSIGLVALTVMQIANVSAVIDQIEVNVSESCTISSSDKTTTTAIANGNSNSTIATRDITFSCNVVNGWNVSAVGSGAAASHVNYMDAASPLTTAEDIATGTATSGGTSNWAFKITNKNNNANIIVQSGYTSFNSIPATATVVATNCPTIGTNSCTSKTISNGVITPTYQVYISPTQPAGTYTGKVTYTIAKKTS